MPCTPIYYQMSYFVNYKLELMYHVILTRALEIPHHQLCSIFFNISELNKIQSYHNFFLLKDEYLCCYVTLVAQSQQRWRWELVYFRTSFIWNTCSRFSCLHCFHDKLYPLLICLFCPRKSFKLEELEVKGKALFLTILE